VQPVLTAVTTEIPHWNNAAFRGLRKLLHNVFVVSSGHDVEVGHRTIEIAKAVAVDGCEREVLRTGGHEQIDPLLRIEMGRIPRLPFVRVLTDLAEHGRLLGPLCFGPNVGIETADLDIAARIPMNKNSEPGGFKPFSSVGARGEVRSVAGCMQAQTAQKQCRPTKGLVLHEDDLSFPDNLVPLRRQLVADSVTYSRIVTRKCYPKSWAFGFIRNDNMPAVKQRNQRNICGIVNDGQEKNGGVIVNHSAGDRIPASIGRCRAYLGPRPFP